MDELHRQPIETQQPEEDDSRETGFTRRRALVGAAVLGGVISASVGIAAAFAHDDHDDDDSDHDDNDHSDDDDHSGHDDDHDDDLDDDDPVSEPSVLEDGSFEVRITDDDEDAFVPRMVTIAPGDTITFVNRDDKDHTATGGDWDTGTLAPGDEAQVTFDQPGEFAYACMFHPEMTGTIVVSGGEGTPAATPQASPAVTDNAVRIFNLEYTPAVIEVPVGTDVIWTNDDQMPHTVTSMDGTFDSSDIAPGETFTLTFPTAGSFDYVCSFHPGMGATVTVT